MATCETCGGYTGPWPEYLIADAYARPCECPPPRNVPHDDDSDRCEHHCLHPLEGKRLMCCRCPVTYSLDEWLSAAGRITR